VHLHYLSSDFSYPLSCFLSCSAWSASGPSTLTTNPYMSWPTACHPFIAHGHTCVSQAEQRYCKYILSLLVNQTCMMSVYCWWCDCVCCSVTDALFTVICSLFSPDVNSVSDNANSILCRCTKVHLLPRIVAVLLANAICWMKTFIVVACGLW